MEKNIDSNQGELKVVVLDNGIFLENIEQVRLIRIKSKNSNLLIMKDHCPVIGEVDGDIIIEGDQAKSYISIKALYLFRDNELQIILLEKSNA